MSTRVPFLEWAKSTRKSWKRFKVVKKIRGSVLGSKPLKKNKQK